MTMLWLLPQQASRWYEQQGAPAESDVCGFGLCAWDSKGVSNEMWVLCR